MPDEVANGAGGHVGAGRVVRIGRVRIVGGRVVIEIAGGYEALIQDVGRSGGPGLVDGDVEGDGHYLAGVDLIDVHLDVGIASRVADAHRRAVRAGDGHAAGNQRRIGVRRVTERDVQGGV